jgi:hypothetical protein
LGNLSDGFPIYAGFTLYLMLGNPTFQQDDDRAVLLLRQDIHSFCPRRYFEGLMMSCRLARPKSGLIERQLLGDFEVATDGGIWVAAGGLTTDSDNVNVFDYVAGTFAITLNFN